MSTSHFSAATVGLMVLIGCAHQPCSLWPEGAVEELDHNYDAYLTGTLEEARRALIDSIDLIEAVDARAHGRAHGLWLGYARLSELEAYAGRPDKADEAFGSSLMWYRTKLEARGESNEEVLSALEAFTPVACGQLVRRIDARVTNGEGAHYCKIGDQAQPFSRGNR